MEQRREILRAIWAVSNTNIDSDFKPYSDTYDNGYTNNDAYYNADPYRHDHTQCKPDSNTEHNAPCYSHTEISPRSKGATYCASASDAGTDSIIATADSVAAAYLASSHNTGAISVLAACHSRAATLVRGITILAKAAGLRIVGEQKIQGKIKIDAGLAN